MADNELFKSLASNLSLEERQGLLEKLKGMSNQSLDALYFDNEPPETKLNLEEQFLKLSWFSRLMYYILSLFTSKPPSKIFEDRQVIILQRKIDLKNPGLYNYQSNKLLAPVFHQLNFLKAASRFFHSALDAGFNKDKGAFFAFLGSLEMSSVHTQLLAAVNPALMNEKNPDATESEQKQLIIRYIEDALRGITDKDRASMYYDARSLFCLKELAFFPFDRMILAFSTDSATKDYACTFKLIKDLLISLNNILFSLKKCPPLTLLESLFIFVMQEKAGVSSVNINNEIPGFITEAEESLGVIRDFNMKIPLTKIIRCASRNASLQPQEISGGEEWYSVYRDFWRNLGEKSLAKYLNGKRSNELQSSFSKFLNRKDIKPLENIFSDTNSDGIQLKGAMSLSFLRAYYSTIFITELDNVLKPIFIDGEFARKENRIEFNESYNTLINIEDVIKNIEDKLSPIGDYGKRYSQARGEMSSLAIKRRKIQIVTDEASTEAVGIVEEVCRSCKSMAGIIDGILGEETKGKYGPMSNYAQFTLKNKDFTSNLKNAKEKFEKTLEILEEMDNLKVR